MDDIAKIEKEHDINENGLKTEAHENVANESTLWPHVKLSSLISTMLNLKCAIVRAE